MSYLLNGEQTATSEALFSDAIPSEALPADEREVDPIEAEFSPLIKRLILQYREEIADPEDFERFIHAFFRNFGTPDGFTEASSQRAAITRQLVNGVYDYAQQHRRTDPADETSDRSMSTSAYQTILKSETNDFDYSAMKQEFLNAISDSVEQLPARQRQVLNLRYFELRPLEEIANLLDLRETTVQSLLRHGVNSLRRQMRQSGLHRAG